MYRTLTSNQVNEYNEDGFLFPIAVLSAGEVAGHRIALDDLARRFTGRLRRIDQCHLFHRWAYDLATHPAVLDVMEDLLGPEIAIHSSRVFYKHPGDPAYVSWHQDGRYSHFADGQGSTAWIALTPSTVDNGCLQVVKGSHKEGLLAASESPHADNLENHGQTIELDIDRSDIVALELRPGEMSVHHIDIIHGSEPDRSSIERIGFSVTYATPALSQSNVPVIQARGRWDCTHLEVRGKPLAAEIEDRLAAHLAFFHDRGMRGLRLA